MAETKKFFICIENSGYSASLEKRKVYIGLSDQKAEIEGLMRVIDESGEDYLYPKILFRAITLPQAVKKAFLAAA